MRKAVVLLSTLAFVMLPFALAATAGDLAGVKKVYLLPMSNGFDQYLANRITNDGVFEVVADIALADAVFTSHIGRNFEEELAERLTPPDDPEKAEKEARGETLPSGMVIASMRAPRGTFGRGRGTVFLVEVASKRVLWSTFAEPKDLSSRQLDRTAGEVVGRLKRALPSE